MSGASAATSVGRPAGRERSALRAPDAPEDWAEVTFLLAPVFSKAGVSPSWAAGGVEYAVNAGSTGLLPAAELDPAPAPVRYRGQLDRSDGTGRMEQVG